MCERTSADLLAISDRFSGVSFAALALPPFRPPLRPLVCAADGFAGGSVASLTSRWVSRLRSAISKMVRPAANGSAWEVDSGYEHVFGQ